MSVSLPLGESARGASILVVDDEPDVADLFRQRFRREARQGTNVMHFAASRSVGLACGGDPAHPYLNPEDVDIALDIDRYDFAVRVESAGLFTPGLATGLVVA